MNAIFDACLGEFRVLRQESVTWMNRIGACYLGRGDESRDVEIRLTRGRRSDADIVVGEAHVQRLAIGFGVDGDCLHTEFLARTNYTQRDLAAVRNKNLVEHRYWIPASVNASQCVSLAPATPCTLSANSLGLVAAPSAASYVMTPLVYQYMRLWSKLCMP